jgi:hypothetical protein
MCDCARLAESSADILLDGGDLNLGINVSIRGGSGEGGQGTVWDMRLGESLEFRAPPRTLYAPTTSRVALS